MLLLSCKISYFKKKKKEEKLFYYHNLWCLQISAISDIPLTITGLTRLLANPNKCFLKKIHQKCLCLAQTAILAPDPYVQLLILLDYLTGNSLELSLSHNPPQSLTPQILKPILPLGSPSPSAETLYNQVIVPETCGLFLVPPLSAQASS